MKLRIFISILFLFTQVVISKAQTGINFTPTNSETAELLIQRRTSIPEMRINTNQAGMQPNQVLISDNYGNATWRTLNLDNKLAISGSYGSGITKDYFGTNYNHNPTDYTGAYITLPPGKWAVNLNFNAEIKIISRPDNATPFTISDNTKNNNFWIRVVLSDNTNNGANYIPTSTNDRLISNLYLASGVLKGPALNTLVKGEIFINNTSSGNKNYYLKVCIEKNSNTLHDSNNGYRLINFAIGPTYESNGGDRFYALPIGM